MTKKEIEQGTKDYVDTAKAYLLGGEMELVRNAFEAGAEWALSHQWHEIDEKLPPIDEDCLFMFFNGRKYIVDIGSMRNDNSVRLEREFSPILDIEEFDYWCEIPPFTEEIK